MAKIYRCKQSFVIGVAGANRAIRVGDIVSSNDPRFKQYKHLFDSKYFESSDTYIERTVEEATAGPGEKRTVTKPVLARKVAAAKKTAAKSKAKTAEPSGKSEAEPKTESKDPAGSGDQSEAKADGKTGTESDQ